MTRRIIITAKKWNVLIARGLGSSAVAQLKRQSVKILVVEDEPLILMALQFDLEDAGHEVITAPNADIGLAILRDQLVDLLLTDVDMPSSIDGVTLAFETRKFLPRIRIVIMSGKPRPEEMPFGSAFISKPPAPGSLLAAINNA